MSTWHIFLLNEPDILGQLYKYWQLKIKTNSILHFNMLEKNNLLENEAFFCFFQTILHFNHNISTFSVHIKLISTLRNRPENLTKGYLLYVFITLVEIDIILPTICTYSLYNLIQCSICCCHKSVFLIDIQGHTSMFCFY